MKKVLIISAVIILLVIIFCIGNKKGVIEVSNERSTDSNLEAPTVSLEEKIGQLFIIGHWSENPLSSTTDLIKENHLGGVIIMDSPENPEEIKTWTQTWQENSDTPLFITIDQEGGEVSRLKESSFIQTSQREIESTDQAYKIGKTRGTELKELGINMNFAPVLDNAINPSSFMYGRAFKDIQTSPELAAAMINGMAESEVIAVTKHFPGHDDTNEDSHKTLPEVNIEKSELKEYTSPFNKLITKNNPQALMIAHLVFPNIAEKPVTLSHFFLTDYLRNELNFKGIVITDDMSMDAIDKTWTIEEASVLSLQAGADIILFSSEPTRVPAAIEAIKATISNGDLSIDRIDESYNRVMDVKKNNLN